VRALADLLADPLTKGSRVAGSGSHGDRVLVGRAARDAPAVAAMDFLHRPAGSLRGLERGLDVPFSDPVGAEALGKATGPSTTFIGRSAFRMRSGLVAGGVAAMHVGEVAPGDVVHDVGSVVLTGQVIRGGLAG
jgi:hypothetical protein